MSGDRGLLPDGFRDRLEPEADAVAQGTEAALGAFRARGYARVAPPLAEYQETLGGRLKAATGRDLMRAVDPATRRMLALRPDITAQVGRIATTRLGEAARPLRLCYGGPVVRLASARSGAPRERTQIGAELIGRDSVAAAAEIVAVALDALDALGATGIGVDLTLPDLVDVLADGAMPLDGPARVRVRALLDAKDAGGLAEAGHAAYLPLIEATGPFARAIERLRRFDAAGALDSRLDGLEAIAAGLGDRARVTLDPTERHGFEYQSWFGFSLFSAGTEIGRGGSYAVVRPDGGEEPAVGMSLYPDALFVGAERSDGRVFLPLGHDADAAARLRREGWVTVAALDDACEAGRLGCSHRLDDGGVVAL